MFSKLMHFLSNPLGEESTPGPLRDWIAYRHYDEKNRLFYCRNSVGFALEGLPSSGASPTVVRELTELFNNVLPEGASMQVVLFADHRISPILDRWELSRDASLPVTKELALRRREFLSSKGGVRRFRLVVSYSQGVLGDRVTPVDAKDIERIKERVKQSLHSLTTTWEWAPSDLLSFVDGWLNPKLSATPRLKRWNPVENLNEQIDCEGTIEVAKDKLVWDRSGGRVSLRSYRVGDWPKQLSQGLVHNLIGSAFTESYRLDDPFLVHYGVTVCRQDAEKRRFAMREQLVASQGRSAFLRKVIPNLSREIEECDYTQKEMNGDGRFVHVQLGAAVWSLDSNLHRSDQTLRSIFRMAGFNLFENRSLHLPHLLAFLPMAWNEMSGDLHRLGVVKTTVSSEPAFCCPLQAEWSGTSDPGMLLLGRRGQLVQWSPFSGNGNYNVAVAGKSGSGKSVFMQELLLSTLGIGGRVYVLDVGRSFQKCCDLVSGQHIEFEAGKKMRLNPFTNIHGDEEEVLQSLSMVCAVISQMASPRGGLTSVQKALVEKAVGSAWDQERTETTITTVASCLKTNSDPRAQDLALVLSPYCTGGVHSSYFDGPCTVSFDNPYVLVELEGLKDQKELQSTVLQLLMLEISQRAFHGDRKTPFHICIDEAWDLLRAPGTEEFIETLARRLRKYRGSLVVGTQSIQDFFKSPSSKAAFENSDWTILLSHKHSSIDQLDSAERFKLSAEQKYALKSLRKVDGEFSELMVCDPDGGWSVCRLFLDPFSSLLYSTNASVFSRIKERQSQGASVIEAIDAEIKEALRA